MKKKQIADIKYGERVYSILSNPLTFQDVCMRASLDKHTVQKTLADLQKHGYISKNERSMYFVLGDSYGQEKV